MTDSELWLTRNEVADHLRVKPSTVDAYVREKRLTRYRIGGTRTARFRVEDVRALMVPNATDKIGEE